VPEALGSVDEAQAALRECGPGRSISYLAGPALHTVLTEVCTGLYVVMAELATAPSNHRKFVDGAAG
jgi:cob(I)alamin adenosyltransferase